MTSSLAGLVVADGTRFFAGCPAMPLPLAGRFLRSDEPTAFSLGSRMERVELARDVFWTLVGCAALDTAPLGATGFLSLAPATGASALVTLETSMRAFRFLAAPFAASAAVDLVFWRAFLGTSAADSWAPRPAAFARVKRVVPAFSSFSLVTARCRSDRTWRDTLAARGDGSGRWERDVLLVPWQAIVDMLRKARRGEG